MTIYTKPPVKPAWGETNTSPADMVVPSNGEIQTGWPLSAVPPSRQRFNWLINYASNAVRYFMQRGIAEWDAAEDYPIAAKVKSTVNGRTYSAKVANINKEPSANATEWERWGYTATEFATEMGNNYQGRLINIQTFTAAGTYTPTAGMKFVVVRAQGGGGGGGGAPATAAGAVSFGAGGNPGSYGSGRYTAAQVGTSASVLIGLAGIGGAAVTGGNGSTTSFGSLLTAPGGLGGLAVGPFTPPATGGNGTQAAAPTGTNIESITGGSSSVGVAISTQWGNSGGLGNSKMGHGGAPVNTNSNGQSATGYGAGGGGAFALPSGAGRTGGAGTPGIVIIEEYA